MRRIAAATFFALSCAVPFSPVAAQDLAAAIAGALASAPTLAEAQAGEAAAAARLDRARAERNPLLRMEAQAGAGRIDNGGFFGLTADEVTPLAAQVVAELPIYTGGRVAAAVGQAQGGAETARLQGDIARLQVTVQAVAAYAEVLTARRMEQSFTRLDSQLQEVERQAKLRFEAGEIASADLAQARARRAEAQAGLAEAQGRRISAEAAYKRLTGAEAGDLAPLPALPVVPPSLPDALEQARMANPALAQARQGIAVAEAAARGARAEAMPTLGAYAEAAHVQDQFFPGYKSDSVAVGVRGRWTLWSGGRTAATARAADADVMAAEARVRQAELALEGMVIDAWQALQTAGRMVEASRLRLSAAQEALRGRRLEARVGAVPVLTVLDAEREATGAEAALVEAEGRQHVSAWQVRALTGNLAD